MISDMGTDNIPKVAAIRVMCDIFDRSVTIISNTGEWQSKPELNADVVLLYAGNGKFYKTEVGKCFTYECYIYYTYIFGFNCLFFNLKSLKKCC